jgi:hypothetical protein
MIFCRKMDAIRKKMQSLKAETEQLYATIRRYEDATKEYTARADQVNITCFCIFNIACRGNLPANLDRPD